MKKGFLLSGKKASRPRAKVRSVDDPKSPAPGDRERNRSHPTTKGGFPLEKAPPCGNLQLPHSPRETNKTQQNPNDPRGSGGMKRGFLLENSSSNQTEHRNGKSQILPQCKLEETPKTGSEHKQMPPTKRTLISSALLDCEESYNGYNLQSQPAVSSMLRFIEEEPDNTNDSSPADCDNKYPSLDGWIIQPSSSSSSLVLSSSGSTISGTKTNSFAAQSGKPLIFEVDNELIAEESTDSSTRIMSSTTNTQDSGCAKLPLAESPCDIESTSPKSISDAIHVLSPKYSLRFANDVSLFLAQLRHVMKSKRRSKNETSTIIYSAVGVGMFIDKQSTSQIQSFVTKHLSHKAGSESEGYPPQLDSLWKIILEQIAQDYTESIHSRKKKRSKPKTAISPELAFGLGIVEFLKPVGMAYESLAKLLLAACANDSSKSPQREITDKFKINGNGLGVAPRTKQYKIMALGASYLIRCRIRCLGITMTRIEAGIKPCKAPFTDDSEDKEAILRDIQSELKIMLSKLLPALDSMVSANTRGGQTILMLSAADSSCELIETSSRAVVLQHALHVSTAKGDENDKDFVWSTTKSMLLWRDTLPFIERLLAAKQCWAYRSDNLKSPSNSSSRVKCAVAVLEDWLDVVKASKRSFFDRFVGDECRDEGGDFTAGLNLFWNLSGVLLKRPENEAPSKTLFFRVGGLAHSLCERQECTFGSSLNGPFCDMGGSVETEDLVSFLKESAKLTDSIRIARKTSQLSEAWTEVNRQRAAIRAFASWLSRERKGIQILTKIMKSSDDAASLFDTAMSSSVALLRSESKESVDICVAALSMLISESPDWLPQSLPSDETVHPQSFLNLLDALKMHSNQHSSDDYDRQRANNEAIIDPTSRTLCGVVAKVASRSPKVLVPYVLEMKVREEIRVEVILDMLEEISSSPPSQQENGYPNDIVHRAAANIILQNFESVPHLRRRIRSNPTIFANMPCKMLIPQMLEHLVGSNAERNRDSAPSLSGLICTIMKAKVNAGHADDFIRCAVLSLHKIDLKDPSQTKNKTASTRFFNTNGTLWRLALLEECFPSDTAYKELLLATAKCMVAMPSSSTPLELLASLVDNQFNVEPSGDGSRDHLLKRISIATSGILQFAMQQISISRQNDILNEQTIFRRLCPLLILRRMPSSYYRVVHISHQSEKETMNAMADLAVFLSRTIKEYAVKNNDSNLAKEEKKLVAELAGHCLLFSNDVSDGSVSLFENICREPFEGTLHALRVYQGNVRPIVSCIGETKLALYAFSHGVPLALDEDDGEALLIAASFVFEVLKYQPGLTSGTATVTSEAFQKEIMMLQSGCINFLAVCVDSMSHRKAKSIGSTKRTPLIEDLDHGGKFIDRTNENSRLFLEVLSSIFNALQSIITTGEIDGGVECQKFNSFPRLGNKENPNATQFPAPSRTSMLNSIVILSQVSRAEDRRLDWLASETIPRFVRWASEGPMDDNIRHPFCIAAALQVIYTLLARCGSFDWLKSCSNISLPSESDFVCRMLQCALNLFRPGDGDKQTMHMLRLAALKVILAAIALIQADESESQQGLKGYLTPKEIQTAISSLRGAANLDQNTEVRQLANQILPYLL